ncbi:MAG: hypothetical protein D6772_12985 [Bacteroidetes bacterium]|nr:MAG: hypothetical protein D6772_12985 [Bacteroidota bacterium]
MQFNKWMHSLWKTLLWISLSTVSLMILLVLLLQIKPVQKWLSQQAASYLSTTLKTEVKIGGVDLFIPYSIGLNDIEVYTPQGDTLLALRDFSVGVNMWSLLQNRILVDEVLIAGLHARVVATDTASNYDFILEAFRSTDTTVVIDDTPEREGTNWEIVLSEVSIDLNDIDVYYADQAVGLLFAGQIGSARLSGDTIDLTEQVFLLDQVTLANTALTAHIPPAPTAQDSNGRNALTAGIRQMELSEVKLDFVLDSMTIQSEIFSLVSEGFRFGQDEQPEVQLDALHAQVPELSYHQGPVELTSQFDPDHLALADVHLIINDLVYLRDSIRFVLAQCSAREQEGHWQLDQLSTQLRYGAGHVLVDDLLLSTPQSKLHIPVVEYELPASELAAWQALSIRADAQVQLSEWTYFLPDIAQQNFYLADPQARLRAQLDAHTRGDSLHITALAVHGPGLHLQSSGHVAHPFRPSAIRADVLIRQLDVRPVDILPLLPTPYLPHYMEWPNRIVASGKIDYTPQRLALDLEAREEREPELPWSFLRITAKTQGLASYPDMELYTHLDTLLLTRQTILAYSPPNLLPPAYQWPQQLSAQAKVNGALNDLTLELRLHIPNANTQVTLMGRVQNMLNDRELNLDLRIPSLQLAQHDIQPLLPDSLLPAMVAWPDLRVQEAQLTGTLDDLAFNVPITTSNGDWQINGIYRAGVVQTSIDIDDIRAADFFRGAIRDTLLALELQPLDVSGTVSGKLSPRLKATITAVLTERNRGQLLDLQAILSDSAYRLEGVFNHPDFRGETLVNYVPGDSTNLARSSGKFDLEKLDLYRWGLSNKPLVASGSLDWQSTGLDPQRVDARVALDDVLLQGGGSTAYVDSLLIQAKLDEGNNDITISGDILQGYVRGRFDPVAIGPELVRFVGSYVRPQPFAGDALVNGHNLTVSLEVKDSRPFTTGLIPGLTELEPLSFDLRYRDEKPELKVDMSIPLLTYAGLTGQNLKLVASGDEKALDFSAQWQDIFYGEQIQLGTTRIVGHSGQAGLQLAFELGPHDRLRYRLAATCLTQGETLSLRLAPTQIVNEKHWQVPSSNQMTVSGNQLQASDWELRKGDQLLRISTPGNALEIAFQNFPLGQWTQLLHPDQTLVGGLVNGEIKVDQALKSPTIRTELRIDQLALYEEPQGKLHLNLSQSLAHQYQVDAQLSGAYHDLVLTGVSTKSGDLNLDLTARKVTLQKLAPFFESFVSTLSGSIHGNLSLRGQLDDPHFEGSLSFSEVALTPTLLGSQLLIDDQTIEFRGDEIKVNDFRIQDQTESEVVLNGSLNLADVTNPSFDLQAEAQHFLALNNTAAENELFYGYLRVNAQVDISGDLAQPRLIVTAAPSGDSYLTYFYISDTDASLQQAQGVVTFAETYEWNTLLNDHTDEGAPTSLGQGAYLEINLTLTPSLLTKVIIDPITQQSFSGRGEGDLTFISYPNGNQQLTGQLELMSGTYDMVLEGLRQYAFNIEEGSRVYFTGDPANPQLDLSITNRVRTGALPLVEHFFPQAAESRLRRRQTFEVVLDLSGDLSEMDINADIRYPEEAYGNQGFSVVEESLAELRRDQSRLYRQAITLITFKKFVFSPTEAAAGSPQQGIVNGLAGAVGDALSSLLNDQLGFVDLNLGVDSYETASGESNYNFRLSIQKSFFDDRLVINVDGVTNTAAEREGGQAGSYLDNISVAYLLDASGQLKIKLFNDRDRNVYVGGNVIRFGGRLVFSKDFDRFFWEKDN